MADKWTRCAELYVAKAQAAHRDNILESEPLFDVGYEVDESKDHAAEDYRKCHICQLRAHGPCCRDAKACARRKIGLAVKLGRVNREVQGCFDRVKHLPL